MQPGDSDLTEGILAVRYVNNTGDAISAIRVSYDIWVLNNATRANDIRFAAQSSCGPPPSSVGAFDYTSPEASDTNGWTQISRSGSLAFGWSVDVGSNFCIYFFTDDVSGSGSRDEFALDNISVAGLIRLPVELASFDAFATRNGADLTWHTESENSNDGFEIQHKQVGYEAWNPIGFVQGQGTTLDGHAYRHEVRGLSGGKHVFRLKQFDFDGRFTYSPEIEVTIEVPGTHELRAAYPNPFNPATTFSVTVPARQRVMATLHDVTGREIRSLFDGLIDANQPQQIRIDGAGLSSGTYLYKVTGTNFTETRAVTLLK